MKCKNLRRKAAASIAALMIMSSAGTVFAQTTDWSAFEDSSKRKLFRQIRREVYQGDDPALIQLLEDDGVNIENKREVRKYIRRHSHEILQAMIAVEAPAPEEEVEAPAPEEEVEAPAPEEEVEAPAPEEEVEAPAPEEEVEAPAPEEEVEAPAPEGIPGSVVFEEKFDAGFDSWWVESPEEDSVAIIQDSDDPTNNVARFQVFEGDQHVSNGLRAEIAQLDKALMQGTVGKEMWYSWRFMVDTDHLNDSDWEVMGQWHAEPDKSIGQTWDNWEHAGARPPVGVVYHKGELFVFASNEKMGITEIQTERYALTRGEWIDMKFHVKWSEGNDGFIEVWVNGEPLAFLDEWAQGYDVQIEDENRLYGPNLMNGVGNFFKMGTYRNETGTSGKSIVYYDDLKMAVVE